MWVDGAVLCVLCFLFQWQLLHVVIMWVCEHQTKSKGLNGRLEKLHDVGCNMVPVGILVEAA